MTDGNSEHDGIVEGPKVPSGRILVGTILLVGLVIGVLITMDWDKLRQILEQADWRAIPAAILFTAISYGATGYLFARVSRLMGIQMKMRDMTEIGFVTASLNHVVTSGGVAGYSVRYLLMRESGVALKDVLAASALHYYLTTLVMLGALPVAFVYLIFNSTMGRGVAIGIGAATSLVSIIFLFFTAMIFLQSMRGPFLRWAGKVANLVIGRDFSDTLEKFDQALARGVKRFRAQPREIFLAVSLVAMDEVGSATVLWFCFKALGPAVAPGVLMAGFVIGIIAGVISMVPGGLGVQEGSMAGVFALLGTPIEQAVLAALLFRVIYFLLPYFASFGFYGRLMGPTDHRAHVGQE